jgi:hypothetical protein
MCSKVLVNRSLQLLNKQKSLVNGTKAALLIDNHHISHINSKRKSKLCAATEVFSETISSTIQFKEDKVFSSNSTCTDIREHVDSIVNYNPRLLFKEKQGTMGWWGNYTVRVMKTGRLQA